MKQIGLIGGLGPESTVDYYKLLIERYHQKYNGKELFNPEIIIYSINLGKMLQLFEEKRFEEAADYIANCLNKLKAAGADFAALTANTPHLLFNEYKKRTDIPLLSIVECCCIEAKRKNLKRCGLFGTKFTMRADFYEKEFAKNGIELIVPDEKEIDFINHRLFTELELGIFKEETKNELLAIADGMKIKREIDSLILGCTEFPIMFREDSYLGIPFLNTTLLHVDAILKESLSD